VESSIEGRCDARFARVRDAFARNVAERDEIGAAVAVSAGGSLVVDLWTGWADLERRRRWARDTIVNVYSCTKGMVALAALQLVDQGRLELDAPVARYWPDFARAGKDEIPVRWLLSHRAALPAVKTMLPDAALYDWHAMTAALAAQPPWWTPGVRHGYHAVTYGWLVGEVVRRITGQSLGSYFREAIAGPLALDFHIGLAESEHARCGDMSSIPIPEPGGEAESNLGSVIMNDPEGMASLAFINPPSMLLGPNTREWRAAEIPGANGHGTARDLAMVYGALATGGGPGGRPLLGRDALALCHAEQSLGPDLVLGLTTRFANGFMLSQRRPRAAFGPNPRAFGHPGAGGSVGFADPDAGVGFGYVMNRMGPHILLDPRAEALIDAVYACLA
jgi:CubicO group peptidase (beta-lactamase class C family)